MSIRDGLLQARGQIAFVAALAVSTAVIIYLEAIDTNARIREQVVATIGTTGAVETSLSASVQDDIEASIDEALKAYEADPSTALNKSAALNAAVLGVAHGIGSARGYHQIVDTVLSGLEAGVVSEVRAAAPALALVSAAMPQYRERISALLARR